AGTLLPALRGMTGSATNSFTPALTQSFRVIEAEGGVAGSFSGLVQPAGLAAGTRLDALYTANAMTLWTTPDDYRDLRPHGVTLTPNQAQVGVGLNALRGDAGVRVAADVTEALGVLYTQGADYLPGVVNRLGAAIYGDAL
ncbi:hypothetical protein, partial [Aphanothece microscopica]|uniref:hypothetical protein n=1 Tax=Aphanothece microscopica TaxID=1049561 RepID=UPI0039854EF7